LRTKNKGKIAGGITHPSEHAELFEEGWEEALAREASGTADVNGDSGETCMSFTWFKPNLIVLDLDISPSESGEV